MEILHALAWKEWRSIRGEALLLAGLAVTWALAWRIVPQISLDVALITVATFLLPGAALLLGASTTAGDGALAFASARPAHRVLQVIARLGVRLIALAAITAATLWLFTALTPDSLVRLAMQISSEGETRWMLVALAGLLACCFASSALVSAFVERPLAAVFLGVAVVALLGALASWALGSVLDAVDSLALTLAGSGSALLALAAWSTARRASEAPVRLPRARHVLLVLGAVSAVLVAWPLVMSVAIEMRARALERDAVAALPSFEGVLERHPERTYSNETQLKVEAALVGMGFDLSMVTWRSDIGPWIDVQRQGWDERSITSPSSIVPPPPPEFAAWLDAREPGLEELRAALRGPELPAWPQEDDDFYWPSERAPGALAVVSRLLLAHAALAISRGDEPAALADLDATWRLAESLRADAEGRSQGIGSELAWDVVVLARKLAVVPEGWEQRLDIAPWHAALVEGSEYDLARRLRFALADGGWGLGRYEAGWGWLPDAPLTHWAVRPLARWNFVSATLRPQLREAVILAGPRRCGPLALEDAREGWSPAVDDALRFDQLRAQMELTRATFALRRARAADPAGAWPGSMPSIGPSACEGLRWVYTPGAVPTIHAEGEAVAWLISRGYLGRSPLKVELY